MEVPGTQTLTKDTMQIMVSIRPDHCTARILSTFCLCLILFTGPGILPAGGEEKSGAVDANEDLFKGTHTFDPNRFFTKGTTGGEESGIDGWVDITVRGHRKYIQKIDPARSALIVVDLNMGKLPARESDWCQRMRKLDQAHADRWAKTMDGVVFPHVSKLLKLFREKGMPVIYLSIGGIAGDDSYPLSIVPGPKDLRVAKYSSGAFSTSTLDNLLREHGIKTLFFVGHDTPCCVSQTMAGAYDRSYQTILISDASYSSVHELHDAAVKIWSYKGFVRTTEQVLSDFPWQKWIDPGLKK
jgi:nicotinamidase-related amidase